MLTLTLFGATGDLARRKLFPSLQELARAGKLPDGFKIQAIGRRDYNTSEFLTQLPELPDLAVLIDYVRMDITSPDNYSALIKRPGKHIFYLAVEPSLLETVVDNLGKLPKSAERFVVLEKPFGFDLQSALQLDQTLRASFDEDQLFRLDHYLGKETVQNLLAFRFANPIIESFWLPERIDHIQLTVAEAEGVGTRGQFYDQTGAIRDILQNHLLQLVSLLLMERPASLSLDALADEAVKAIGALSVQAQDIVIGQYEGYDMADNVRQCSTTETFVAAKICSSVWPSVPIYVRTGKAMERRVSEITIQLKEPKQPLYECEVPNLLTLRLQPDEGINLQLLTKSVGSQTELQAVAFEFCFDSLAGRVPDAYESLLLNIFAGDRTFALRSDVIEASWKLADSLRGYAAQARPEVYAQGSWGPIAANTLIERDGRTWLLREHTFCNGVQINQ